MLLAPQCPDSGARVYAKRDPDWSLDVMAVGCLRVGILRDLAGSAMPGVAVGPRASRALDDRRYGH